MNVFLKKIMLIIFLCLAGARGVSADVVFQDDFTRADSTDLGNSWVEQNASVGSISSNKMLISSTSASAINVNRISRPMIERYQDQTVSAEFSYGTASRISGMFFRTQSVSGNLTGYATSFNWNTSTLGVSRLSNGTSTAISGGSLTLSQAINQAHTYRLTASAIGISPTTITITLHNVTTDTQAGTITVTDSFAGLQTTGTVGLYNNDNAATVNIDNFIYSAADYTAPVVTTYTTVPVSNSEISFSPYNWYDATTYRQANSGGAYFKVAFTGTTLGLAIDDSQIGSTTTTDYQMRAYIDGSSIPIEKTFADVDAQDIVLFTDSLSAGNHYAIVYMQPPAASVNRWAGNPVTAIMVEGVALQEDEGVISLTGTPLEDASIRTIFYGDSITEGANSTYYENGYAPKLGRLLEIEYGQAGYNGLRWTTDHSTTFVTALYSGDVTIDSWANHSTSKSRLTGGVYTDGTPDGIFNALGVNDARNSLDAPTMRSRVAGWIDAVRDASSTSTDIYMIVPFNFGNTYATYKTAYLGGVSDYRAANPSDYNVHIIDLGVTAWNIVDTNSSDDLHPDDTGAGLLANLIYDTLEPLPVASFTASATSTPGEVSLEWTAPAADANSINHVIGGYSVEYKLVADSVWLDGGTFNQTDTDTVLTGLGNGDYDFKVTTLDTGLVSSADAFALDQATPLPGQVTVSFNTNGGSSVSPITDDENTSVTLPSAPTRSGYTFTEWNTASNGSGTAYDPGDSYALGTSNSTLYAIWEAIPTPQVTVSFNTNGGSAVSSITDDENTSVTLPSAPTKNSYTFVEWDTAIDGSGTSYDPGDSYALGTVDTTLYAIWAAIAIDNPESTPSSSRRNLKRSIIRTAEGYASRGEDEQLTSYVERYEDKFITYYNNGTPLHPDIVALLNLPTTKGETTTHAPTITRNLSLTIKGDDVKKLQEFLITANRGSFAKELARVGASGYFGIYTKNALAEYQKAVGIQPPTGYFGPITRRYLEALTLK